MKSTGWLSASSWEKRGTKGSKSKSCRKTAPNGILPSGEYSSSLTLHQFIPSTASDGLVNCQWSHVLCDWRSCAFHLKANITKIVPFGRVQNLRAGAFALNRDRIKKCVASTNLRHHLVLSQTARRCTTMLDPSEFPAGQPQWIQDCGARARPNPNRCPTLSTSKRNRKKWILVRVSGKVWALSKQIPAAI